MPRVAQKIKPYPRQLINGVLGLVTPATCPITREDVLTAGQVSAAGWRQLHLLSAPWCDVCGMPFPYDVGQGAICSDCQYGTAATTKLRAAMAYTDGSRGALLAFKHADQFDALAFFVRHLHRVYVDFSPKPDVVIPIPLYRTRLISRRFNQAAELAKGLARVTGCPFDAHAVCRTRHTESQGHKPRKDRHTNVEGAFAVGNRAVISGKHVLLVDDVMTTGATIQSCAQACLDAGAATVSGVAVARVI